MLRKRQRTTHTRSYSAVALKRAVEKVLKEGASIRQVAKEAGIPRSTIKRYVIKATEFGTNNVNSRPCSEHLKIFSHDEEKLLPNYIKHACLIYYGLSTQSARKLAYEFATANGKEIPTNWSTNKMSGKEWMNSFMQHHALTLRTTEQTSLGRATELNVTNVNLTHWTSDSNRKRNTCYYGSNCWSNRKHYNNDCSNWMINHPGRSISIYDIGGLIRDAFPLAFTLKNICDMPVPSQSNDVPATTQSNDLPVTSKSNDIPTAIQSNCTPVIQSAHYKGDHHTIVYTNAVTTSDKPKIISPEQVCPHRKAPARNKNQSRRTVKSAVLTDTPVKQCLEEKAKLTAEKKAAAENRKMLKKIKAFHLPPTTLNTEILKRKLFEDSSSSNEELPESSSSSCSLNLSEEENDLPLSVGSYALVKVHGKRRHKEFATTCEGEFGKIRHYGFFSQ
ncbi:hypothetical protein PR048_020335 [Dryococelus australis]|uniref:HTH psq-type domain-containing protein n=1 Tax=Dryococelus australis TaxID=614101 RepID=A0ABQ9H623_9NEOP|nr:hypothetical protein PR048_020335 [Dryococelus australis]